MNNNLDENFDIASLVENELSAALEKFNDADSDLKKKLNIDPNAEDEDSIKVTSDAQAMRVADKLIHAEDTGKEEIAKAKQNMEDRIAQAREDYNKAVDKVEARNSFYKAPLQAYAMTKPKGVLDIVNLRIIQSSREKFKYPTKKEDLVKLAEEYAPEIVKVKEIKTVAWKDFKQVLNFTETGDAVSEDGELVKGIKKYTVSTPKFTPRKPK